SRTRLGIGIVIARRPLGATMAAPNVATSAAPLIRICKVGKSISIRPQLAYDSTELIRACAKTVCASRVNHCERSRVIAVRGIVSGSLKAGHAPEKQGSSD